MGKEERKENEARIQKAFFVFGDVHKLELKAKGMSDTLD